jgi:hypothetical protein
MDARTALHTALELILSDNDPVEVRLTALALVMAQVRDRFTSVEFHKALRKVWPSALPDEQEARRRVVENLIEGLHLYDEEGDSSRLVEDVRRYLDSDHKTQDEGTVPPKPVVFPELLPWEESESSRFLGRRAYLRCSAEKPDDDIFLMVKGPWSAGWKAYCFPPDIDCQDEEEGRLDGFFGTMEEAQKAAEDAWNTLKREKS